MSNVQDGHAHVWHQEAARADKDASEAALAAASKRHAQQLAQVRRSARRELAQATQALRQQLHDARVRAHHRHAYS